MMKTEFSDNILDMADEMAIKPYDRFSISEAALFLRCNPEELIKLTRKNKISFIQVTSDKIEFFAFQLLEYLQNHIVIKNDVPAPSADDSERILRTKDVLELVGLSRSTIWRMQRSGTFPQCVNLSTNRIGWLYSDVMEWVRTR